MNSMTEEEICRLINEGGNATFPEIEIPTAYLVQDSSGSKVFLSQDSLNKCLFEKASELGCLLSLEKVINYDDFSTIKSEFEKRGVKVSYVELIP